MATHDNTGSFLTPAQAGRRTLNRILSSVTLLDAVERSQVEAGDLILVRTRNSLYCLRCVGADRFEVSGGWFDANVPPAPLTINGCTWGGTAIARDLVAACGLFLEFGNGVRTTRIQEVRTVRPSPGERIH